MDSPHAYKGTEIVTFCVARLPGRHRNLSFALSLSLSGENTQTTREWRWRRWLFVLSLRLDQRNKWRSLLSASTTRRKDCRMDSFSQDRELKRVQEGDGRGRLAALLGLKRMSGGGERELASSRRFDGPDLSSRTGYVGGKRLVKRTGQPIWRQLLAQSDRCFYVLFSPLFTVFYVAVQFGARRLGLRLKKRRPLMQNSRKSRDYACAAKPTEVNYGINYALG